MNKIYTIIILTFIVSSCLDDSNNEQEVSYTDTSFSYEIELLEDDWYNEIRKYDEEENLVQTITYEYNTEASADNSDTIIKRIFGENNDLSEIHHYIVDSNRLAKESWDTLFTDTGRTEASALTYVRDSTTNQLQRINHNFKVFENQTEVENSNFAYAYEFESGDIQTVTREYPEATCNDEYYTSDTVAELDIYSFRQNLAFSFDGRITGDRSEHLLQGIALSYDCYPRGYYPQEILMNYELNADKTVSRVTYLIFPARSVQADNVNASRLTHTFTYMDVE